MADRRSFRDKAHDRLDANSDELLESLVEQATGNGTVQRRVTCETCGNTGTYQIQVADARSVIEILKFLEHSKPSDPAPPARTLETVDLSALSTAELLALVSDETP